MSTWVRMRRVPCLPCAVEAKPGPSAAGRRASSSPCPGRGSREASANVPLPVRRTVPCVRLVEVHVRVDESRKDDRAFQVQGSARTGRGGAGLGARHRRDRCPVDPRCRKAPTVPSSRAPGLRPLREEGRRARGPHLMRSMPDNENSVGPRYGPRAAAAEGSIRPPGPLPGMRAKIVRRASTGASGKRRVVFMRCHRAQIVRGKTHRGLATCSRDGSILAPIA